MAIRRFFSGLSSARLPAPAFSLSYLSVSQGFQAPQAIYAPASFSPPAYREYGVSPWPDTLQRQSRSGQKNHKKPSGIQVKNKMSIIPAGMGHLKVVKSITLHTIKNVYPLYYPKGAVGFFISHHQDESILKDIQSGYVYIKLNSVKDAVGTVTIRENEICRLFVLPQYQKQGYGSALLDFAENKIARQYETIRLDASLPAKPIYMKRGYTVMQSHCLQTQAGDFLCYDEMWKNPGILSNREDAAP